MVQLVDLFPTMLELLGIEEDLDDVQGRSLFSSVSREIAFAEYESPIESMRSGLGKSYPEEFDPSPYDQRMKMINDGHYKYIWSSLGSHELYDLEDDPDETHNLIKIRPEIATKLHSQLEHWSNGFQTLDSSEQDPEFDKTIIERLEALGYL